MKKSVKILVLAVLLAVISSIITSSIILNIQPSKEDLMEDFYLTETAIHVSPHGLRKHIAKGDDDFIIVDLRSQEEYEKEHIIGAVNIPAYKSPDKSAYGDVERIVSEFAKLPKDKDIIVYCYSIPCMTGRKVGKMLAEHGIYVQHLGIGWNEWRYYWDLWNHEHEWNVTDVQDYIAVGSEPGIFETGVDSTVCDIKGELGC